MNSFRNAQIHQVENEVGKETRRNSGNLQKAQMEMGKRWIGHSVVVSEITKALYSLRKTLKDHFIDLTLSSHHRRILKAYEVSHVYGRF